MGEQSYSGIYFLLSVLALYTLVGIFRIESILPSLMFSFSIFKNVIPVLVLIFALMAAMDYYVSPKSISKHIGKSSGYKKWVFAILGGIISTGPIYMWYPMLKELKKQGVGYGFIATFIYNRAIKLPLLPIMLLYFNVQFIAVLTLVMIIASLIIGLIFEKIEDKL
ncbi:MAG: hypothetical protein DRP06_00595 [Candidatus Aenigmatarchaeota archaeon]|nr:MAG: hypothetical protein DRP06_00595 [Candidatus Aenigmarchaeota archaeon]